MDDITPGSTVTRRHRIGRALAAMLVGVMPALVATPAAFGADDRVRPGSTIYTLTPFGRLDCYRQPDWYALRPPTQFGGDGPTIRSDFHDTKQILSTGTALFRLTTGGQLFIYESFDPRTCSGPLGPGRRIDVQGQGWGSYQQIFPGPDGVIYGLRADGTLWWHRYPAGVLSYDPPGPQWKSPVLPLQVGVGWNMYSTIFTTGLGEFYGIRPNGDMYWYRHNGWANGSMAWEYDAAPVGTGWNRFARVEAGQNQYIFAQEPDGDVFWYRNLGPGWNWATFSGTQVDVGWVWFRSVAVYRPNSVDSLPR